MTTSEKDKEEGDNDARPESQEAESASGEDEQWIDYAQRLQLGSAKNQWRDDIAEEEVSTMSQPERDLVRDLCERGVPFTEMRKIMGISEDEVSEYELKKMYKIATVMMGQSADTQGGPNSQAHSRDEDADFQPYDPVLWETAAQETTVDESSNEEDAGAPDATEDVQEESSKSSKPAPTIPTSKPEYVRALKDSGGWMPYFKKGDILRVIKTSRRNLDGQHFELLPLKPPGQSGQALIRDFEPADQADVDAVGRMACNEKEKDSFRCAVEWQD